MSATTGSGGLPGPVNWAGLGMQGAGMAEGAGQAATQSGVPSGAQPGTQSGAVAPSSAALVQAARTALAAAQAQQADVMLTLSEGAQTLLGKTQRDTGGATPATGAYTARSVADGAMPGPAGTTPMDAGTGALMADVMQAANAVMQDPSATAGQKTMASELMQMATAMVGQSASGMAGGMAGGVASDGAASLLASQASELQSGEAGTLGGAVVGASGLYGLASAVAQDGRLAMATAMQEMGAAQAEEIVLPGGIVQLPLGAAQVAGSAGASMSVPPALMGNALTNALLPQLFKALSAVLADASTTPAQKAAATALLQMLDTADNTAQIPQALLNPLLAAALMPALSPSVRGRLVRAALAGEVEDMGSTEEAELATGAGVGGLRAALRKNAAYLAAVQHPLLAHVLQLTQRLETEGVEVALAGWGTAGLSREQIMEEAIGASSILAFSQNLVADSTYMGALASTSLTPILIMSWAALLSGCLPRAYPFVPRVWRRANKKKWRRKNRRNTMSLQNLLFAENATAV